MANEPTGGGRPDDPDAIRAEMAETRAALTEKLEALRERVLGPADPAPKQGVRIMAVKKSAGAAKKGSTAKKATTTKKATAKAGAAKATVKATVKVAAPKKTAAAKKSGGKKTAVAKASATRKSSRAASKPAAAKKSTTKKSASKKGTGSRIVEKAKEVLSDVLVGAAGGAIKGAAQAVVPQVEQAAMATERVAGAPDVLVVEAPGAECPPGTERTTI